MPAALPVRSQDNWDVTLNNVLTDQQAQITAAVTAVNGATALTAGLPRAGAVGQLPFKNGAADYATAWRGIAVADVPDLSGTYAPILTTNGLLAAAARAEASVSAGTVPPRMSPTPTVIGGGGAIKGTGLSLVPTVAAGGTGYVVGDQITLAGGVAAAAAILQVATVTAGAVTSVTIVRYGIYTTNPGTPTGQASTTGAGTGATFTTAWANYNMGNAVNRTVISPIDARIRFTGVGPAVNIGASGYFGSTANATHSSFEWSTDSQRLDLQLIGGNTNGVLIVDGKQVAAASVTTDVSGAPYVYSIDFGSSVMRTFRWLCYNAGFGGFNVDGTATVSAPLTVTAPLAWALGDSYTLGQGSENAGSSSVMVMASQLGLDLLGDGVGGTGWNTVGASSPVTRVTSDLAAFTRTVNYVFLDLGFNDAGGDMVTLATAVDATIAAVKTAASSAKIIAFGPATPLGRTTNLDLVRDTIKARCAVAGVPFVDVGDWVNTVNKLIYTGGDNIHPTVRGHKYLGARRAEAIRSLL